MQLRDCSLDELAELGVVDAWFAFGRLQDLGQAHLDCDRVDAHPGLRTYHVAWPRVAIQGCQERCPTRAESAGFGRPVSTADWVRATLTYVADAELDRLRAITLALPDVTERLSHGAPCFFVRSNRPICYYHDADFSGEGASSIWCPALPGVAEELAAAEPDRFFRPQPSASGAFATWLGVHLDAAGAEGVDWALIATVIEDAYRMVAPKKLIAEREV